MAAEESMRTACLLLDRVARKAETRKLEADEDPSSRNAVTRSCHQAVRVLRGECEEPLEIPREALP